MLRNRPSRRTQRERRAGTIDKKLTLVGVLVLIAVGAVGMSVWRAYFGPESRPSFFLRHKCRACGIVYSVRWLSSSQPMWWTVHKATGNVSDDCHRCGAKRAVDVDFKCPKCEKYFLPKWYRDSDPSLQGQPGAYTCEHCGTDALTMEQWYMEDAEKRKSPRPPATQRGDVLQK